MNVRRQLPLFVSTLMLVGCSGKDRWQAGRPPVYESGGVVMHEGQPLAGAVLNLLPVAGTHAAYGRSDEQGRFQLTTFDHGDGAVAGEYKVAATCIVVEHEPNPKDPEHLPPLHHAEYSRIPESYGDAEKSGLTLTIPEGGKSELRLELTGKPSSPEIGHRR